MVPVTIVVMWGDDAYGDRVGHVEPVVRHDPGDDEAHDYVEQRANDERPQYADRHVPLRVSCLLCRRGYGVKTDIRKEDHRRAAQHAAPAELTGAEIGRYQCAIGVACRHPVGRIHEPDGSENEDHHDAHFYGDNDVVDLRGFLNARDQQHRRDGGHQYGRGIEKSRCSLPFAAGRIKFKRRPSPDVR
jgi:hypothetical protein